AFIAGDNRGSARRDTAARPAGRSRGRGGNRRHCAAAVRRGRSGGKTRLWRGIAATADKLLQGGEQGFSIGMFEPVDTQLSAARRLPVEVVCHGDEAGNEGLVSPQCDRIAAVDWHNRNGRLRALTRRGNQCLKRG